MTLFRCVCSTDSCTVLPEDSINFAPRDIVLMFFSKALPKNFPLSQIDVLFAYNHRLT